jgi:DNA end-binding protein Ku
MPRRKRNEHDGDSPHDAKKPRPLFRGNLGFGLVSIPVSLQRATAPKRIPLFELHDHDGARIKHRAVCSLDGAPVPREHIVRGYEVERGRYITLTRQELSALDAPSTRFVEIVSFVDPHEIDAIFYEKSYYLVPQEGSERAYTLLASAMTSLRRAAIANVTLRARRHLAVVRPNASRVLVLSTLGYQDELLPAPEIPALREPTSEREHMMAERLVDALSDHFRPERFHDDRREQILALVKAKAEGALPEPAPARVAEPPADLLGALAASIEEAERHKNAA